MDLKDRLMQSEQKLKEIQGRIQQHEQQKQGMLQELLRLDGELRLLAELMKPETPE